MSEQKTLKKSLGLFAALSTVVGIVIGSGVFFKASAVFAATEAPGLGILVWAIAGVLTIAAGLTTAELASSMPETGGIIVYLKRIYGDTVGFLTGWMLSILYYPGLIAALGFIFADNTVAFLGLDSSFVPVITFGIIILLAFANALGSKSGGAIQNISTIFKIVLLASIIIIGFTMGDGNMSTSLSPLTTSNPSEGYSLASAVGTALLAVLFSFEGWLSAGNLAGEMKRPEKDLPIAIISGISIVTVVYVIINMAYLWVLPAEELAVLANPAAEVATTVLGEFGGKFISAGIIISVFGTLNALILTGPRTLYTLAVDNNIPFISKPNKNGAPGNAIWVMSILGALYSLTQNFGLLTDVPIFTVWVFYILTFVGVFVYRKQSPNVVRPYKVPLYPFIPIVAILGGGYVVVSTLINQTSNALLGLGIALLGLPLYFILNNKNKSVKKAA